MPFSYLHYTGVCRCEGSRTGGGRVCRSVTYIIQVFVIVKGVELEVAGFAGFAVQLLTLYRCLSLCRE